jgi:hypothetical protein
VFDDLLCDRAHSGVAHAIKDGLTSQEREAGSMLRKILVSFAIAAIAFALGGALQPSDAAARGAVSAHSAIFFA